MSILEGKFKNNSKLLKCKTLKDASFTCMKAALHGNLFF